MSNEKAILGQRFLIDTHIPDSTDEAVVRLWKDHGDGWIQLCRSDVLDTELGDRSNAEHRAALLERSAELVEVHGVVVLGHSRLDHAVLGSDEDAAKWDAIWQLLWPNHDRADTTRSNRRRVRDAMHVWTAHRYGFDAFVTLDGSGRRSGLLDRSAIVKERLGLWIARPEDVIAFVDRLKTRYCARMAESDKRGQSIDGS